MATVPPFLDDNAITESLAADLKIDVSDLKSYHRRIITEEHGKAARRLYSALIDQGYSLPQIAAWTQAGDVELELTSCLIRRRLRRFPKEQDQPEQGLKEGDTDACYGMLEQILMTLPDGTLVRPAAQGLVRHGVIKSDQDVFRMPTRADDPRIGGPYRPW